MDSWHLHPDWCSFPWGLAGTPRFRHPQIAGHHPAPRRPGQYGKQISSKSWCSVVSGLIDVSRLWEVPDWWPGAWHGDEKCSAWPERSRMFLVNWAFAIPMQGECHQDWPSICDMAISGRVPDGSAGSWRHCNRGLVPAEMFESPWNPCWPHCDARLIAIKTCR